MCLISVAYQVDHEYPLIIIANRDEFLVRPTSAAHFWPSQNLLAGRDEQAGGTWMGITKAGRLAAITNYRAPTEAEGTRSRGHLVTDFLTASTAPDNYRQQLQQTAMQYSGYNLLFGHPQQLLYFSNRSSTSAQLQPGIHGLSNHLLDTPWPKVASTKAALADWLTQRQRCTEGLFAILADTQTAADSDLPTTGIGYEKEKALSARFITLPHYATRTSTVLLLNKSNDVRFIERTFDYQAGANKGGAPTITRQFQFRLNAEPLS